MLDILQASHPELVKGAVVDTHDTTKWHKVPGYAGRIGFITRYNIHSNVHSVASAESVYELQALHASTLATVHDNQ